jgi:uncharacterized protein YdeI (YjbR/CyaY-like superfamily)
VDLQHIFSELPVGKQNHIIAWVAEALRPQTRKTRSAMIIQAAFRARGRAGERGTRRG